MSDDGRFMGVAGSDIHAGDCVVLGKDGRFYPKNHPDALKRRSETGFHSEFMTKIKTEKEAKR